MPFVAHVWPQLPQLPGSLCRLTQLPLQSVLGLGQTHWPLTQTWPFVQALPHAPQLFASLATVTQDPLQFVVPLGQTVRQWPLQQTWWVAHLCPHLPQFFGLLVRWTQTPPQETSPTGHLLRAASASLVDKPSAPTAATPPARIASRRERPLARPRATVSIASPRLKRSFPATLARNATPRLGESKGSRVDQKQLPDIHTPLMH